MWREGRLNGSADTFRAHSRLSKNIVEHRYKQVLLWILDDALKD